MSLYKQLWLAIVLLLTLVFGVSFLVTTLSARNYLEQQLGMKNTDNAAALALSLTQQGADPVLLELTLAAQFDTGHYALIELADPEGRVTIRRIHDTPRAGAPEWFTALFPIRVEPGIAQIQAGWQQAGTLTLRSHSRFAYAELWRNTMMLAGIFLLAAIVAGFIGTHLLRRILDPLANVVQQAQAIGKRQFITTPEPRTLEFRQVVAAMNTLSASVKQMLGQESGRLQKMQRESHVEKISGLYHRDPFLRSLAAAMSGNDANASGTLCMVRISELGRINQNFGRVATDQLLKDVGNALNRIIVGSSGWSAARMNGSDFAVLAPRELEPDRIGRLVQDAIRGALDERGMGNGVILPGATTVYQHNDKVSELLTRLDGALIAAEQEGSSTVSVAFKSDISVKPVREQLDRWRQLLGSALRDGGLSLARYPVVDLEEKLIHFEAPVRLDADGRTWNAGQFLPWIHRLRMAGDLDKQVVELALREITAKPAPVAINLSAAAIADGEFSVWLEERLLKNSHLASKLWVEIPEAIVFRQLANFKRLTSKLKAHGVRVGIEHLGHQLADLGQLHEVGLDYLKVDASFVRDIHDNPGNQTLLRALCTLGHSIGVSVIAEGVESSEEWDALKELGIDGATGPGITLRD